MGVKRSHVRRASAVFLAVIAHAGCSQATTSDQPNAPQSMEEFRAWVRTVAEDHQRAVDTSIEACMQQKGFAYEPAQSIGADAEPQDGKAQIANSIRNFDSGVDASTPTGSTPDDQPVAYYEALGDPEQGGCTAQAIAEVGSDIFPPEVLAALDTQMTRIQGDPSFSEAKATWATCMNSAGFAVTGDDEGDPSRVIEDKAVALFREKGYASTEGSLDETLASSTQSARLTIASELEPFENSVDAENDRCLKSSGLQNLQDEWVQLLLQDIPMDYFDEQ